ncbi:MAG: hypothetical protein PHZ00_04690 [Candidatus Peribacteraceae bacterium]|nr:hypothetical protein [Candidatus Peribacteraceae bacterium]
MENTIKHDVHRDHTATSSLPIIVAIIAILVVIGIALYALQVYPFNTQADTDMRTFPSVNTDLDGTSRSTNFPSQDFE